MTHKNTWKAAERRVASLFGTQRTSLSGGNGKVTRSDSHHPDLFIEAKLRQSSATWNLFVKTRELARKESKTPVLALSRKHSPGVLLVIHQDDLYRFCRIALRAKKGKKKKTSTSC